MLDVLESPLVIRMPGRQVRLVSGSAPIPHGPLVRGLSDLRCLISIKGLQCIDSGIKRDQDTDQGLR